ncbi:U-box domain [Dillenia turbinata]|uniref:U-box domain n=1 Tax=Dillenia turbinata TaxID=194707 RepID=A0AAN8VCD5_9MAGN
MIGRLTYLESRLEGRADLTYGRVYIHDPNFMVLPDSKHVDHYQYSQTTYFGCGEVMKNPHVAADGFSYELEAIEEWLGMAHDTSPMTNLRLKHKHLTPNHTLRTLIQDWYNSRSLPPP